MEGTTTLHTGFWCHCLSNFKTESAHWEGIFQHKWSRKTANPRWSTGINPAGLNEVMKNGHKFYGLCLEHCFYFNVILCEYEECSSLLSPLKFCDLYVCKQKWQIHAFLPIPCLRNLETITVSSCFHSSLYKFCKNLFSSKSVSGNTGPTASSEWLAMFENDAHRVRFMQLCVSLWSSCLKGSSPYKVAQFLDCRALCLPDKW